MFELRRQRVANLTSCSEITSESETVAKNCTEFQCGSNLQGTSSEALIQSDKIKIEDDENAIKLIKMQVQNNTKQDNAIVVVNLNLISKYMKPKIG